MRARFAGALWLALAGCGAGEDWIARVDGETIGRSALQNSLDARLSDDPELLREEAVEEELNRLLADRLILNRADELDIQVSDEEVGARIASLHGADFAAADGEFREEVHREMTLERTALVDLADRLTVAESALLHEYEERRERYREPARVQIRQIVVADPDTAAALRSRLEDGEDFAALAAEHSLAPEAGEGGLLPAYAKGELPEEFDRAFELDPGEVSRVIESVHGYHIFRLESLRPERDQPFHEVRDEIAFDLERRRMGELRREWLRELRRRADIDVNQRVLEELR